MIFSWKEFIAGEVKQDYFSQLNAFLQQEKLSHIIFPAHKDVLNAFKYCPLDQVKVVIVGADPYINPGQAHGLSFSVPPGIAIPPSLNNICKELASDLGIGKPTTGCLIPWAKQGVLLLNATLTVRQGESNSHYGAGWELFTSRAIQLVNQLPTPVVYILWGSNAKKNQELITNPNSLTIESSHPSPFSASKGFFGSKPFSRCNQFLQSHNLNPIDWSL